jgi:Tfp pilus assembly protein PilN
LVPGSVDGMDEARQVLERLRRIEELEQQRAPSGELIDELRKLICEGEAWLRAEGHPRAAVEALERCRAALPGDGEPTSLDERAEVALLAR